MLHSTAAQAQTFTISGIVTGIPENEHANVAVQSGDAPGRYRGGRGNSTGPDGKWSRRQPGATFSIADLARNSLLPETSAFVVTDPIC